MSNICRRAHQAGVRCMRPAGHGGSHEATLGPGMVVWNDLGDGRAERAEAAYAELHEQACKQADKLEALILRYVKVGPDDVGDAVDQLGNALARLTTLAERRLKGLHAVETLIDHSEGVVGLHRNGDTAPWAELRADGRFESWLKDFDAALE